MKNWTQKEGEKSNFLHLTFYPPPLILLNFIISLYNIFFMVLSVDENLAVPFKDNPNKWFTFKL